MIFIKKGIYVEHIHQLEQNLIKAANWSWGSQRRLEQNLFKTAKWSWGSQRELEQRLKNSEAL